MKLLALIFNILVFLGVAACAPTEIIREREIVRSGVGGEPRLNEGGTSDGGGNGYSGKPLESYSQDVYKKEKWTSLQLIIENLQKTYPPFAADFAHLLLERRWYFMPGELNKIPVERIGVSFPVDQIALQSLGEIWVNDKLFAAMEFQDRELLIVHELVMGIRLMEFQSSYDKCIAAQGDLRIPILLGTATDEHQELWKKARRGCTIPGVDPNRPVGGLPTDPTKKLVLTKEDYLNIRSLVTKIWSEQGQLDPEEIKDWLNSRKFR